MAGVPPGSAWYTEADESSGRHQHVATDAEHGRHAGAGAAGSARDYRGFKPAGYK
jgi:hypothetical protein